MKALFWVIAALLVACGTPEKNAPLSGVSQADAMEINRVIHAASPHEKILSYTHNRNGSIYVVTSAGTTAMRKRNGKWEINQDVVVLGGN